VSGLSFSLTKRTAIRTVRLCKSGQIRDGIFISDSASFVDMELAAAFMF
jgi:hypothetical protein